ncbi:hypothetical protein CONLIGDRAFT_285185 [Coniochaeta ligniaria NRRL 30616]|uniref:Uncharacterized protein n=1 Tax=Coniochaeta ligniaria NRRL 30616 TaxID=1408157 RepID=A0A1J7JLB0_9PEZI|nr:hypothetical protein CONLIGDRAFT_285185 [Coniochaeta ligniaria NRRL 30616]
MRKQNQSRFPALRAWVATAARSIATSPSQWILWRQSYGLGSKRRAACGSRDVIKQETGSRRPRRGRYPPAVTEVGMEHRVLLDIIDLGTVGRSDTHRSIQPTPDGNPIASPHRPASLIPA